MSSYQQVKSIDKHGEVIAHTSQRYKIRKELGFIMYKESFKLSHYERFTLCHSYRPTRDLPHPVQNSTENRSRKTSKKTNPWVGPPFSSWIADQVTTELTQNKTEANNLLINSKCATKTTRAMVTLEFNNQERKT